MRGQNEIVFPRLNCEVADSDGWKVVTLELRPNFSTINRDIESEFGAKKKEAWLNDVFLDYVCVPTNAFEFLRCNQWRPGFAVVGGAKDIRRHVAKGMAVEGRVSGGRAKIACLHPTDP